MWKFREQSSDNSHHSTVTLSQTHKLTNSQTEQFETKISIFAFWIVNSDKTMITVSEKAKTRLASLKIEEGKPENSFLRVGVAGGGCSGLSYKLDFDTEIKPGDQIFNDNDFQVVVDMKSFLYLAGTELNYDDGLNGKGFEFQNPNASRTCACGESFAV